MNTLKWLSHGLAMLMVGLGTVAAAGAPPSGATDPPHVYGHASGILDEAFGDYAGDEVDFTLDMRGTPATSSGTFTAAHHVGRSDERRADFTGQITCLLTAGEVATATGVVTRGYARSPQTGELEDITGDKVSFTVQDEGRRDRMYWMWEWTGAPINDCQGLAPAFSPSHSSLHVRD